MAESVVSFVVERLGELLIEEVKFIHGVGGQVQEIYDELRWMKAFLKDADAKQNEEERIRVWVADVRTLAYDAGDVLESFLLRVESKRGGGIKNILKRYVCILNECVVLHNTGSKIQGIKARILELKSRLETYGIRSLSEASSSTSANERFIQFRRTYSHVVKDDFVGLEGDVEDLVGHLVNDGDGCYKVVSICGLGGLGKTTIARKVYNHEKVKRYFGAYAWVCISQKWQLTDILQQILIKLIPEEKEKEQIMKFKDFEMIKKLFKIQQEKRCLIVLDDIWSKDAWDCLKNAFPLGSASSKLLLTSRNTDVAIHVNADGFVHRPRMLSEDESWTLLKKKAFSKSFQYSGPKEVEEMEKLGIKMARQCGGLPLAVAVLGGILVTKHRLLDWKNVHRNIKSLLRDGEGRGQDHGGVEEILELSYNDLPYHLKPCFLYLGKFLEDSDIEAERLYQLWMAESIVLSKDKREGDTMMDVAESYLGELAQRSMVQFELQEEGYEFTKFKSCRLHDLIRDLCLSKAKEEDFFSTIDFQHENNYDEHVVGSSSSFTNKARRLVIYFLDNDTSRRDVSLEKKTSQRLRSLLFFNETKGYNRRLHGMVKSHLNDFKLLRVLAIEGLSLYNIPSEENWIKIAKMAVDHFAIPKAIGNLNHLRYLSLRGTVFVMFPSSIENLKYLQTLDLRGRFLLLCPCKENVLGKMRQLRHLYLPYVSVSSINASKLRLDGLINLEILENFDSSWCRTEDLIKLINLRKLKADVKLQNLKEAEDIIAYITNLKHIRHSSLMFYDRDFHPESWRPILEQLVGSECVHELTLWGCLGNNLPEYNNNSTFPSRFTKLKLYYSYLVEDPMPVLEALPNLRDLYLIDAFKGEKMVCSSNGFLQLKNLKLSGMRNLQNLEVEDGAMPMLSLLQLSKCPKLKTIPNGLRFITTLKKLEVSRMPLEFESSVKAVLDGESGEDFEKIGHVASVTVGRFPS